MTQRQLNFIVFPPRPDLDERRNFAKIVVMRQFTPTIIKLHTQFGINSKRAPNFNPQTKPYFDLLSLGLRH
jgi:hypothetical protein